MKKVLLAVMASLCLTPNLAFADTIPEASVHSGMAESDGKQKQKLPALDTSQRFALTLAGGGARGAAHIGVLKVLEREGLRPAFVCGSSVGALIGGLYAAGVPVSDIERLAVSGELGKAFFPRNRKMQILGYVPNYALRRMVLLHPKIGIFSGKSISKFVAKNLPTGVKNIEDMQIPFSAASVDLLTTKPVWLSKGDIAESIRASNSLPGLYRPVSVGDHLLVDGGVRTNLPTEIAEAKGAPIVVAVRLQAYLEKVDQKEYDTIFDYADRLASIMLSEIESKAVDKAEVIIEPVIPWMRMNSFQKEKVQAAIAAGEKAAEKMLPQLLVLRGNQKKGAGTSASSLRSTTPN